MCFILKGLTNNLIFYLNNHIFWWITLYKTRNYPLLRLFDLRPLLPMMCYHQLTSRKRDVTQRRDFLKWCISGIFHVDLIFAEFATSLKSPKIDTAKNKSYFTPSLRILEIVKIGCGENLTHLPGVIIFAKISQCEKFPIWHYKTLMKMCMEIDENSIRDNLSI